MKVEKKTWYIGLGIVFLVHTVIIFIAKFWGNIGDELKIKEIMEKLEKKYEKQKNAR